MKQSFALLVFRCFLLLFTSHFKTYRAIPESVRWLLTQKQNTRAKQIVQKAARTNGVLLSQELLSAFDETSDSDSEDCKEHTQGLRQSAMALIRSRKLVMRSLYLFFIW